jgi:hypothetical protein
MREKADRELVLPQKIERDKRGCYIGCELRRVYLVKEDFFLCITVRFRSLFCARDKKYWERWLKRQITDRGFGAASQ